MPSSQEEQRKLRYVGGLQRNFLATLGFWQDARFDEPNISADYNMPHSQARNAVVTVDTNNNTDDKGSFCDPSTSTTTSGVKER